MVAATAVGWAPPTARLKAIYKAFNAESQASLRIAPNAMHEMENPDLRTFLAG